MGHISRTVWDRVWQGDRYSRATVRLSRARHKLDWLTSRGWLHGVAGRVLEIGCGSGYVLRELVQRRPGMGQVVGCDISFAALRQAHDSLSFCAPPVRLVHASASHLPFASGTFNAVLAFGVLEHMQDPKLALDEIHRVLALEGTVLLIASSNRSFVYGARLLRQMLGLWPYGFQRNVPPFAFKQLVENRFPPVDLGTLHTAFDFPASAVLDRLISLFAANWGRYILVRARRGLHA